MQTTEELISITDPGETGRKEHNRGDRFVVRVSNFFAWLFPILMLAIVAQVLLRSAGMNQAWLDDLQWWMYGSASLIAIGYAVTTDSHVRVDIFHANFTETRKNRLEIFGLVWLFLPFVILAWDFTLSYAFSSVSINEGSDSPNGLHKLWILKCFMNLSFVFIAVAIWSTYVRYLSKMTKPVIWKQLLWAFPSTVFGLNLVAYYVMWWVLRLTTDAEVTDREIGRSAIFGEFEIGAHDIKYTVLIGFALAIAVILGARALHRKSQAEG